MKPKAVLVVASLLTLLGAIVGSTTAVLAGRDNAIVAMVLGGAAGVVLSVTLAIRIGWLPPSVRDKAIVGGLVGFTCTAVIVVATINTFILPLLSFILAGLGVLAGANRPVKSDEGVA